MTPDQRLISDGTPLNAADRVDIICDSFDQQWAAGQTPRIEDYLEVCEPPLRRALFLELFLVELERRGDRGESPLLADYLHRFPDYAGELQGQWFKRAAQRTTTHQTTLRAAEGFSPGKRINQFELLELVGSGGSGQVWRAHDTLLQRTVAIKVSTSHQLSEEGLHRFLREGQAAAQLRHSHLVRVYEVGLDDGTPFIISDFIEGQDLRTWLRKGRPQSQVTARMVADLAEALHHAHEHGVIHRDLKPANVLLDNQGQVHVTDFGVAKWTEDERELTLAGQLIGTPAYMSPEQARGASHRVDRRTDVYALGALLYEMLAGQQPFAGDQSAVLQQIIHDEPRRPRSIDRTVPRDLETVCLKAMEKDPHRRYASAQELAVDLRRYLRGEAILARPVSQVERSWRWIQRRPAVTASIILALLTAAALGAVQMLAVENRELLGLRPVSLMTDPPGARITLVPLNLVTDEPIPEKIIQVKTFSPVATELRPGNYLVIADLQDGRFHEVFRHVPAVEENLPGHYRHLGWTIDEEGRVVLPCIDIPDHTVSDGMAFIQGTDLEMTREDAKNPHETSGNQRLDGSIASFYVDFGEVTVGDYRRRNGNVPPDLATKRVPDTHALTLRYDQAVSYAEKVGKRLPTIREFQFVATCRQTSCWPWGNQDPPDDDTPVFGPVGSPEFDRLAIDPRVVGLMSNVAELTSTSAASNQVHIDPPLQPGGVKELPTVLITLQLQNHRFVAGGDRRIVEGNATVSPQHRAPSQHYSVSRGDMRPGLGFRCVRSAQPRTSPQAFGFEAR